MSDLPISADQAIRRQMDLFRNAVGPHVQSGQPYALLDFPNHSNIGDSAIYAGELAFFDAHAGRRADCVCTWAGDMDWVERQLPPEGPIFLQGGGNFGDLWLKGIHTRVTMRLPSGSRTRTPPRSSLNTRPFATLTMRRRMRGLRTGSRRAFSCSSMGFAS